MNYYRSGAQIQQSDEILRKLNQIKQSIQNRKQTSPNNLGQYLPSQALNSSTNNKQRINTQHNPQSYRQSLQKKLERLFKQQRKNFNQNQISNRKQSPKYQSSFSHPIVDSNVFTIQKMEDKIKQLERKYLHSNPIIEQRRKQKSMKEEGSKYQKQVTFQTKPQLDGTPNRKTKSIYEKDGHCKIKQKSLKKQKVSEKSDKKLITQISMLKKQVKEIKQSNVQLNQKLFCKQKQKQEKKQRSRYLLRCILMKLVQIQQQIKRRDEQKNSHKQKPIQQKPKGSLQQRKKLISQNANLIRQVQQLTNELRKETSQKQRLQERSNWIENQLRRLNRM